MKTEIKKLDKSQIEVEFKLSAEEFQEYIEKALLQLKDHVKMDGFRKGHVPASMVEEKVGKENLLMEAGDLAVKKSYHAFLKENNIEAIGEPDVQILKIAKGNPLLFKIKVSVLPEIKLPDYKEIVSKVDGKEITVEPNEIEEALNYLQKSRAKFSQVNRPAEAKDFIEIEYQNKDINDGKEVKDRFILGEGGFLKDFEDNVIGMKAGEEKEFISKFPPRKDLGGKDGSFKVKMILVQKMELPEINDDFAKSLGAFDTLVALKENLKGGITLEKQESERQRKRGEILNKISGKIAFDLPEKMVEYEEKRLFEDFKNQISQNVKIDFGQYLASIKKTEDEIKKSFKLEAEKRIKNFLTLRQIGKSESIEVLEKELEEEISKVLKSYSKEQLEKPFGATQGKFDIGELKEYTKGAMFNEKVFEKLESFSKI